MEECGENRKKTEYQKSLASFSKQGTVLSGAEERFAEERPGWNIIKK